MNNIAKSLDNLTIKNFTDIKIHKNLKFYLTLLSIARELFCSRKNFAAYRLIDESSQPNDADIIRKLLDNFYNNGDSEETIKRLNSIEELISKCNTSITESELVLIKCGFDEIINFSSEVLLNRIEKLLKDHTVPYTLTAGIRSSILHYNQAHENANHEKYNTIINFVYLIILHLNFFFKTSTCEYIKNNITEDFFYCDSSIIDDIEKDDLIFNLYKDHSDIHKYSLQLIPSLTPDEIINRISIKFGLEKASRYFKINNNFLSGKKTEITNKEIFAKRLTEICNVKGRTQADLARELSIAKTTLNTYFNTAEKIPNSFPTALAYALNVAPDYLVGKTDQPDQFLGSGSKPSSKFYSLPSKAIDCKYQKSDEYYELRNEINNMPNPFKLTINILDLSEHTSIMLALYKKAKLDPEFLWSGINDAGKELNQEKLKQCTEIIENFLCDNQTKFTKLDEGNKKLIKLCLEEICPIQNELANKLQELEKELASVIIPK